jgi:hypothetical protein
MLFGKRLVSKNHQRAMVSILPLEDQATLPCKAATTQHAGAGKGILMLFTDVD